MLEKVLICLKKLILLFWCDREHVKLLLKGKIHTQDSGIVEINGRKTNISSDGLFSLEIDVI